MKALSIDVGIKNLAIYIEEFDHLQIQQLKIPENTHDKNNLPTKDYNKFLKKIYNNGKCIFIDLVNLTNGESAKLVTTDILMTLFDYLESKKELFDSCSFVMIEQQMNSRFKKNTSAQHIQHHIESWFIFNYRDFKPVIIYPSKNKGDILGAPKKIEDKKGKLKKKNKQQLKKWAELLGLSILENRNDKEMLDKVLKFKKRDDVMDALIQLQSIKIKIFIQKKLK